MRRSGSIKILLIVNLVMTLVIGWSIVAEGPVLARRANAGEMENALPDAGAQRLEMIRELRRLNLSITDLRKDLAHREFDVSVKSMPPVQIENK